MVVVASLFLIISALFARYTRGELSTRGLYALNIETLNRANIVAEYDSSTDRWRNVDREVIYGCDTTLWILPGEEILYRGSVSQLGNITYIHLTERGIYERRGGESFSYRLNNDLLHRLKRANLTPNCEAVASTMMLSRDENISEKLLSAYRSSGSAHILAVSGLHVSIVALLIFILLTPLTLLFRGDRIRVVGVMLILWLFAFANFMGASVERAVIMYTLLLASRLTMRSYDSLSVLSMAVIVMSIIDPTTLYDVGFQLSCVAVISIVVWALPLWQRRPRWMRNIAAEVICMPTLIAICCTIATLPIVSYTFGSQPLYGFIIAPIIYITSFLILLLSALLIVVGAPFVPLSAPLEWCVALQNGAVEWVSRLTTEHDGGSITIASVAIIYLLYIGATIYVKENYKDKSL